MAVKGYLLAQHLSADRVFVGAAQTQTAAAPTSAAQPASAPALAPAPAHYWTPHAELALDTR